MFKATMEVNDNHAAGMSRAVSKNNGCRQRGLRQIDGSEQVGQRSSPNKTCLWTGRFVAMDGANISGWSRRRGEPRLAQTLAICRWLEDHGVRFGCWFDASFRHCLRKCSPKDAVALETLLQNYPELFKSAPAGVDSQGNSIGADAYVLRDADSFPDGLVLTSDLYRSEAKENPHLFGWTQDHSERRITGQIASNGDVLLGDNGEVRIAVHDDIEFYVDINKNKKGREMGKSTFTDRVCGTASEAGGITVYDDAHQPIVLDENQFVGRGSVGECIYAIASAPEYCVKLFRPQDLADAEKRQRLVSGLDAMLKMSEHIRDPHLAWPLERVMDERGAVIGYVLRRIPKGYVSFRAIFGGATSVSRQFPNWGRRELALVAKNFIDELIVLEQDGVRVADFTPENFLVNDKGEVIFRNCDTFMFFERCGKVHTSGVFNPEYAPVELLRDPELVGKARTEAQTCFSAAVLAYSIVMTGHHPFMHTEVSADGRSFATLIGSILTGMCPLGYGARCRMPSNWYATWSWITGSLQSAFIATFREGWENPVKRTPLRQLSQELDKFAYECTRMPERNALKPVTVKPREQPRVAQMQSYDSCSQSSHHGNRPQFARQVSSRPYAARFPAVRRSVVS